MAATNGPWVHSFGYEWNGENLVTYSSSTTGSSPYFENYFVGADTSTEGHDSSGFIGYSASGGNADAWQWVNVGGDWKDAFDNNETSNFYRLMEDYSSNGVEIKLPTPFSWFDILDIED